MDHTTDWESFIIPASSISRSDVNTLGHRPGSAGISVNIGSEPGFDIYFQKTHVCRVMEIGEARQIFRALKEDSNLLPVFQVHAA